MDQTPRSEWSLAGASQNYRATSSLIQDNEGSAPNWQTSDQSRWRGTE